ncbi:MlaC/ttg2D family ABC transporter substrate-binding protein [Kingella negevensis]|uniref:MlaC/ttg2D family ABC transporter substrate-binding protein n=1 Tax=Kingella negevensis TaxID=1522312 RepID=UPI00050A127B|nr:ABC transporter substrate-binding protein [Kingella negevensis]MDK4689103.1 ABC transporter substrate-binding protein [Kingella negevensis]WII90686.1 ABC transporter substrate-binding protein [Kingella negevensis]
MKKTQILTALSIGVLSINMAFATPQQAVEQVKDNATQVLQILKKSNGKNDAAVRKQAENYALPYFDFPLMTRLSVGAPWNKATEAQKQTLVNEFRTMLIQTYASQMLRYKNAQVTVNNNAVAKDGGSLLRGKQLVDVRVTISNAGEKPVQAVFSTYQDGNTYKVFNVTFEGVFKLVENQRAQFKPILDSKGIDGLITTLKAKNGQK